MKKNDKEIIKKYEELVKAFSYCSSMDAEGNIYIEVEIDNPNYTIIKKWWDGKHLDD